MWLRALTAVECFEVLAAHRLAHLACATEGRPYLVPIHYAYSERALYMFSLPGKKIDWMRANNRVSVLVESGRADHGWTSVIADGWYEELPEKIGYKRQRDHAWSLLSKHANWWEPGALKPGNLPLADDAKHVFFRVVIDDVSGRQAASEKR